MSTVTPPLALAGQTTDSISRVDQQVETILQIPVPPASVGNLQADFAQARNDTLVWPQSLRSQVVTSAEELIQVSATFDEQDFDGMPQAVLQLVLESLHKDLDAACVAVQTVVDGVGKFRQTMDRDAACLKTDLDALNQKIAGIQEQVRSLQQQVQAQQDKIKYYEDHPWKLILDGLTIIGLIEDLDNIISAERQAEAAMEQLQQEQQMLQPLLVSVGPLTDLIEAMGGLTAVLINMYTAAMEAQNGLKDLLEPGQTLPPEVIAAELDTDRDLLQQAAQIAREILQ